MAPVDYMLTCAAVMVTCLTFLVLAVCLFVVFVLVMWGAGIVKNFRSGLATEEPPHEYPVPPNGVPTRFPGDRSFNRDG